tara:strand:- start:882 stop:1151 length:270 start_codon:yes stop_codon:yes gene_type:complete
MNKYLNPFHIDNVKRKNYIEHDIPVYLEHRGIKVFKRYHKQFDIVQNNVCISMRCGVSVDSIDRILSGNDAYAIDLSTMERYGVATEWN